VDAPRSWTLGLVAGLLALGAPSARGADAEISPDRPDVTNNTETVRPGVAQVETGLEYSKSSAGGGRSDRRFAAQLTLRGGLGSAIEARLEGEPIVRLSGECDDTGPGDVALGLKYRVVDAEEGGWWPSLGLQPMVKLPVAEGPIGTGRPDFELRTLASFDLPARFALDVGPLLEGAAYEIRFAAAPTVSMLDGYMTIDTGAWHFHLCVGDHRGTPSPELARARRVARCAFFTTEGGSCAPTTWGLRLWNGRAEQMITILFPSPHFDDEWRRLREPRWEKTELWRALRRRYTGTG